MEIWTDSQMASIHKMLNPRSIAVIGATPRLQYGGRFLGAVLRTHPVNGHRQHGVNTCGISREGR